MEFSSTVAINSPVSICIQDEENNFPSSVIVVMYRPIGDCLVFSKKQKTSSDVWFAVALRLQRSLELDILLYLEEQFHFRYKKDPRRLLTTVMVLLKTHGIGGVIITARSVVLLKTHVRGVIKNSWYYLN